MSRTLRSLALIPLALLLLAAGPGQCAIRWLQADDDRLPWELALDLAKRNHQPIMAFVFVRNLKLAEMMEATTFGNREVSEAVRKLLCVQVDALRPENREFLDRYGVGRQAAETEAGDTIIGQSYPVTLFIAPDGTAEHIIYGFVVPEDFVVVMAKALEVISLREKVTANAEDPRSLAALGAAYVELQRYDAAREALEKALKLPEAKETGVGDAVRLDLAVAVMAAKEGDRAVALVSEAIALFPDSPLRCRAHYLLGGSLLAIAQGHQDRADELTAQNDEQGAALASEQAILFRRQAEEAWEWFEAAPGRKPGCTDPECQMSQYALGTLSELRVEMEFIPVEASTRKLMEAGKFEEAADAWRAFAQKHPSATRACEAAFRVGECLLKAGKREQALEQWRKLAAVDEDDPSKTPCAPTPWRGAAQEAVDDHRAGQ